MIAENSSVGLVNEKEVNTGSNEMFKNILADRRIVPTGTLWFRPKDPDNKKSSNEIMLVHGKRLLNFDADIVNDTMGLAGYSNLAEALESGALSVHGKFMDGEEEDCPLFIKSRFDSENEIMIAPLRMELDGI